MLAGAVAVADAVEGAFFELELELSWSWREKRHT